MMDSCPDNLKRFKVQSYSSCKISKLARFWRTTGIQLCKRGRRSPCAQNPCSRCRSTPSPISQPRAWDQPSTLHSLTHLLSLLLSKKVMHWQREHCWKQHLCCWTEPEKWILGSRSTFVVSVWRNQAQNFELDTPADPTWNDGLWLARLGSERPFGSWRLLWSVSMYAVKFRIPFITGEGRFFQVCPHHLFSLAFSRCQSTSLRANSGRTEFELHV